MTYVRLCATNLAVRIGDSGSEERPPSRQTRSSQISGAGQVDRRRFSPLSFTTF